MLQKCYKNGEIEKKKLPTSQGLNLIDKNSNNGGYWCVMPGGDSYDTGIRQNSTITGLSFNRTLELCRFTY